MSRQNRPEDWNPMNETPKQPSARHEWIALVILLMVSMWIATSVLEWIS